MSNPEDRRRHRGEREADGEFPVVLCPTTGALPRDAFRHPSTEGELVAIVDEARRTKRKVRVVGSAHSVPGAIYGSAFDPHDARGFDPDRADTILVMLDRYRAITWVAGDVPRVRVQAGRNLGADPFGPPGTRTDDDGLVKWLDDHGYALPEVGGITHQTVGGFLATGSAGASTRHSFERAVESIRFVDGRGEVREVSRRVDPDTFHALGVSMGLLGIVSEVTFVLEPRYGIAGSSPVTSEDDCEVDLFGPGDDARPSLARFFEREDYARILWWPQRGVRKVVLWKARRIPYDAIGLRQPYDQLELPPELAQKTVGALYRRVFTSLRDEPAYLPGALARARKSAIEAIIRSSIHFFVSVDGANPAQEFRDTWWQGIPTDNQMSDVDVPVNFTELWLPLDRAAEAMSALRDLFEGGSLERTGTMCLEIYATGASAFPMSAAHGRSVLRIDPFVFSDGRFDATRAWYPLVWETLRPFDFRFHWGKALSPPGSSTGVAYRRASLPGFESFARARQALDPDGIFLSDYWSRHLGLGGT